MKHACYYLSPLGWLHLTSDGENLTEIRFNKTGKATKTTCPILQKSICQLKEYFLGQRTTFELPLRVEGTQFQKDVWAALSRVPYGKKISYAEIAKSAGHPHAYRAVGSALGKNRIPIILPCHRIVKSDETIGGFTGGLHIKKKLLEIETRV